MFAKPTKRQPALEIFLVAITIALACLFHEMAGFKMIVLNLFYLPVILAAFFLGRYRAGILALFCVITISVMTAFNPASFAAYTSPMVVGLAVIMWGAVLGLVAILCGTLSDERTQKTLELHEAYVGVVEVLSRYLRSGDPALEGTASRVAEISHLVAQELKMTPKDVDDVRVAALLHDMENVEITSRVIRRAVGDLEAEQGPDQHTFHGTDLVHSLGTVLTGALPLLLEQSGVRDQFADEACGGEAPRGARIIQTVRAYQSLVDGDWGQAGTSWREAVDDLRSDNDAEHDPAIVDALERALAKHAALQSHELEPAL